MFETFGGCECRAGVGYFTVHSLYSHPSEAAASAAAPFPNPPLRINSRESSGDRPTATPTFSSALGSSSLLPLRSVFSPVGFLSYSRSRRFNFLLTPASITPSFRQKIRQKSQDKNEGMSRFQSSSNLFVVLDIKFIVVVIKYCIEIFYLIRINARNYFA